MGSTIDSCSKGITVLRNFYGKYNRFFRKFLDHHYQPKEQELMTLHMLPWSLLEVLLLSFVKCWEVKYIQSYYFIIYII